MHSPSGAIRHKWQPAAEAPFEGWGWLGDALFASEPTAARGIDGRVEVFAVNDWLFHIRQTPDAVPTFPGSWSGAPQPPRLLVGNPAALAHLDGRIEVAVRATDGRILTIAQDRSQPAVYGPWTDLGVMRTGSSGVSARGDPALGRNADDRLEVFVRGTNGELWHRWQNDDKVTWSAVWESLGMPKRRFLLPNIEVGADPTAVPQNDRRLELFVPGSDAKVYHRWQQPGWQPWAGLGAPGAPSQRSLRGAGNADGREELFVRGSDNAVWHRWMDQTFNWPTGWVRLDGISADGDPVAILGEGDRLQVAVLRGLELLLNRQTAPNNGWGGWQSLGAPEPRIGQVDVDFTRLAGGQDRWDGQVFDYQGAPEGATVTSVRNWSDVNAWIEHNGLWVKTDAHTDNVLFNGGPLKGAGWSATAVTNAARFNVTVSWVAV